MKTDLWKQTIFLLKEKRFLTTKSRYINMELYDKHIEMQNRYCPICGKYIRAGSPIHICSKKDLLRLEKMALLEEIDLDRDIERERFYGDRLQEFEDLYDNAHYYDLEDD
jgi:hypothetical protein